MIYVKDKSHGVHLNFYIGRQTPHKGLCVTMATDFKIADETIAMSAVNMSSRVPIRFDTI